MDSKRKFYIDAYIFICGLMEYMNRISTELSHVCITNYVDKFKISRDTVNRLNLSVAKFINKWDNDDENICKTLKTIKEYYGFYCITLSNSSPSMFIKDSKYIIDSLYTSKMALVCNLKKIKEKI